MGLPLNCRHDRRALSANGGGNARAVTPKLKALLRKAARLNLLADYCRN
jgi:hypothetical protein